MITPTIGRHSPVWAFFSEEIVDGGYYLQADAQTSTKHVGADLCVCPNDNTNHRKTFTGVGFFSEEIIDG